ncbi:hypothetical protein Cgig2_027252 [Carnegiea gigantea]|uniref:Uncharacterized protein n=1 Tax=Carnegiea gigantea TaxID=171969 RepID=A0A9Q1QAH9_9CARY|nr:hypothetical protein Cgig2_027252 [Carnegiea gigantea]
MDKIEGKHDVSYDKLSDYIEIIKLTNPSSHAYINWDNTLLEDVARSSDSQSIAGQDTSSSLPHAHQDSTSNFVETFNNGIKELRGKPILTLLEGIRKHIQLWLGQRKAEAEAFKGPIVPSVKEKLKEIARKGCHCSLVPNGQMTFDCMDYNVNCTGNIQQKFCDYGFWKITGIPCRDLARSIHHNSATCKGQGSKPSVTKKAKRKATSDNQEHRALGKPGRHQTTQVASFSQPSSCQRFAQPIISQSSCQPNETTER